jgi:glycosyltransferase involved in cell wall biosynthesis
MRTIGVAIPCYIHHIHKLKSVLDSIQNQTTKPSHVVVSCSSTPDDNKDVADLIQTYSPFFQLEILTTTKRKNAAENRNIASRYLHTDIISYMDADDVMHPQRLEYILYAFEHSDCSIVLHSYDVGNRSLPLEFMMHNKPVFEYGKLARAPSGCAVHIDDYTKRIHHAHSSISYDVFSRIQYREESSFNRIPGVQGSGGCEDSLFCGDVLQNVFLKNAYIPMTLSLYFEEGQTIL